MITRRTLFGFIAAPAVIRLTDLMPVKKILMPTQGLWGAPTHTFFISSDAPPLGDGRSWSTAFRSLQEAVDAAPPDSLVYVHEAHVETRGSLALLTSLPKRITIAGPIGEAS